jgi:hypothetical protein
MNERSSEEASTQVRISKPAPGEWASTIAQAAHVPDPQLVSPPLEDLEKDGARMSREQLQCLALSLDVRQALKSNELQHLIASVDGAPCREAALAHALQNPVFAQFCESILDVVSPSS